MMRQQPGTFGLAVVVLSLLGCGRGPTGDPLSSASGHGALTGGETELANNQPHANPTGKSASFSTAGFIDLTSEFFVPQGSNGRHCATCHLPEDGWSIRPETAQRFFDETDGLHPLFNIIDANSPVSDVSTVEARRSSYTMLLQGKFIRLVSPPATRDYDVIAAQDPFNFGTTSRLMFFRRPLPTANFKSHTVMWDAANTVGTDLRAGLVRQARGNVTGAQQGPPASDAVINAIVDAELGFSSAQLIVNATGNLSSGGAQGGPEAQSTQPLVAGRFDLFDAWANHGNPRRAQIARGQEVFNNVNVASGRRCGGCHNAANNGQNVAGTLFNVGASNPQFAKPDMAVYTLRRRSTGETAQTTDPGQAIRNGQWAGLNRFKTPNIRDLAARAPYFHNGIAADLPELVTFYEQSLGFDFTPDEEADLVAFLNAL